MTPDKDELFSAEGFGGWWDSIQAMPSYASTKMG